MKKKKTRQRLNIGLLELACIVAMIALIAAACVNL